MKILRSKTSVMALSLALVALVALWATSAMAAKPEKPMLPKAQLIAACSPDDDPAHAAEEWHPGYMEGLGYFQEKSIGEPTPIMIKTGESFVSRRGLKTVPFDIVSFGGRAFAEGVGETRFWLDATRPVTSAIWEKRPGTEFPAIQEMRFHIFYTLEAMPGRVFRSVNPVIMRSENVRAFPPPPGTVYNQVRSVDLEDVSAPGIVVGRLISNRVVLPPRMRAPLNPNFRGE